MSSLFVLTATSKEQVKQSRFDNDLKYSFTLSTRDLYLTSVYIHDKLIMTYILCTYYHHLSSSSPSVLLYFIFGFVCDDIKGTKARRDTEQEEIFKGSLKSEKGGHIHESEKGFHDFCTTTRIQ